MPLALLRPGNSATVTAVRGGRGFNRRLASMGILPGVQVRMVSGAFGGPVIIEVRGSRVVVGRGMAHRVVVEPAS